MKTNENLNENLPNMKFDGSYAITISQPFWSKWCSLLSLVIGMMSGVIDILLQPYTLSAITVCSRITEKSIPWRHTCCIAGIKTGKCHTRTCIYTNIRRTLFVESRIIALSV